MAVPTPLDTINRRGLTSTHWTTIRACQGNDERTQAARETLCRDYWYPLYAYIKRRGHPWHAAEDLTQEFFAQILGNSWFERVDCTKGRFRAFLFTSLDNFLQDRADGRRALKRGGSFQHLPLDMVDVELRYARSQSGSISPTEVYEIEWAASLVDTARRKLEAEYFESGKRVIFEALRVFLAVNGDSARYEEIAQVHGMSADNIKVYIHRLRRRYGAILREEVARTVDSADEIAAEMIHLRATLAANASAAA